MHALQRALLWTDIMTVIETQTLLTTIDGHLAGKAGTVYGINISNGTAAVSIDWIAFKSNFGSQTADRVGNIWSKTVGAVTYTAKDTSSADSDTVPV